MITAGARLHTTKSGRTFRYSLNVDFSHSFTNSYNVQALRVHKTWMTVVLFNYFQKFLPCRCSSFLFRVHVITGVSIWIVWVFISWWEIYLPFSPTIEYPASSLLYPQLSREREREHLFSLMCIGQWENKIKKSKMIDLIIRVLDIILGLFLTRLSSFAFRWVLLQTGTAVLFGSSDLRAKLCDYIQIFISVNNNCYLKEINSSNVIINLLFSLNIKTPKGNT